MIEITSWLSSADHKNNINLRYVAVKAAKLGFRQRDADNARLRLMSFGWTGMARRAGDICRALQGGLCSLLMVAVPGEVELMPFTLFSFVKTIAAKKDNIHQKDVKRYSNLRFNNINLLSALKLVLG